MSLNPDFTEFFDPGFTWKEQDRDNPTRGLTATVGDNARTTIQRVGALEVMLNQIACWAPIVARSLITKDATSLNEIWQTLRNHYGMQKNGAYLSGWCYFELAANESHEDLF